MSGRGDKTVLITGAAKRIGRALALDFAARGWRVGVHYNRSRDAAEEVAANIRQSGGRAVVLAADLRDLQQVKALTGKCAVELGPVNCLVNNASVFEHDDIKRLDEAGWALHMDVNLRAPVMLAQDFAARLPGGAKGNIINIIDQRVWRLNPRFFSYTIAKSALWTATRTLAQALAPDIRVNAIGPGPTLASSRQNEASFTRQKQALLLKSGPELAEICAAVKFILGASSMTGQMIALDGGQHLAWQTPDIAKLDE